MKLIVIFSEQKLVNLNRTFMYNFKELFLTVSPSSEQMAALKAFYVGQVTLLTLLIKSN